ncbi:MAG: 3',5'-cyclic-nucleotide phosphodiesterase [Streblomastix strix]|uniref:Phosphodiesterase n=1 Tax=Streblomastix strix TaxID=222440 RepID=A0A5J4X868_9EUKA|nr:MAG: 3',5'-cyclic-nucleotide phosphodiesterase [Streblomastix strix]
MEINTNAPSIKMQEDEDEDMNDPFISASLIGKIPLKRRGEALLSIAFAQELIPLLILGPQDPEFEREDKGEEEEYEEEEDEEEEDEDSDDTDDSFYQDEQGDNNNKQINEKKKVRRDSNNSGNSSANSPNTKKLKKTKSKKKIRKFIIRTQRGLLEDLSRAEFTMLRFALQDLGSLQFDTLLVHQLTHNHALTVLGFLILQRHDLLNKFNIDVQTAINFFFMVEKYYFKNPYHSAAHAADVLQMTHWLCTRRGPHTAVLSDLDLLTIFISAACHDMGHPGLNNDYLKNTGHKLALLYNDSSPLENSHVANAFLLIEQQPECDILANLQSGQRIELRRMMINMILATDVKQHFPIRTRAECKIRTIEQDPFLPKENAEDRELLMKLILMTADISNGTRPWSIAPRWSMRILEEGHAQGDRERLMGMTPNRLNDRTLANTKEMSTGQIAFLLGFVKPMIETVDNLLMCLKPCLDNLNQNVSTWDHISKV